MLDRRGSGVHVTPVNCCNMYGPPPNCKKNRFRREQSAKMYPASEWTIALRAILRAPEAERGIGNSAWNEANVCVITPMGERALRRKRTPCTLHLSSLEPAPFAVNLSALKPP